MVETTMWYVAFELNRLINSIGHIWHPYFSEHMGIAECLRVFQNLQSNSQQQNDLQPELFWGKSGVEWKLTNIQDSGISWTKWKVYRQDPNETCGCTCYTCENTSLFSRKSRVLHTFWCVRLRGYTRQRGAPVVFIILLFNICWQYVYGDGNATLNQDKSN